MERMAALGVSPGCGRNELDCSLRDELDDVGLLRQRSRPSCWRGDRGDRGASSARASRFRNNADLLAYPALDVPAEDFLKDLSDSAKHIVQRNSPSRELPIQKESESTPMPYT